MRKIKDIQTDLKAMRAKHRAEMQRLQDELAATRAVNAKAKKAKAEPRSARDTTKESARRAVDAARERMKDSHPDHGGTSEAFQASYAQWKKAEARYHEACK